MNAHDILDNMSRGWNCDPAAVALGTDRTGLSAALWARDVDDVQEVWAEPDPDRHVISVPQSTFRSEMFFDGRLAWATAAPPGTCSVVCAGQRPRAIHSGRYSVLHLYVPTKLLNDLIASDALAHCASEVILIDPACSRDLVIERISRDVRAEMREGQPLSRLRIDALGLDLAVQLLRRHSNFSGTRGEHREPRKGGLAPHQLKRVTDRMLSALHDDVSLAELAGVAELSPTHFCTAFRQSTGLPPHRWFLGRRMERAKELLADPRLSLTEIALEVGYSGQGAFGAAFRRATGTTPSAWRRELHR